MIDVGDLEAGTRFWAAALHAQPATTKSPDVYPRLKLPDSNVHVLIQQTHDPKADGHKERMHLDIETTNVEVEVQRQETLGASRKTHQTHRGFDYWILTDHWATNYAC